MAVRVAVSKARNRCLAPTLPPIREVSRPEIIVGPVMIRLEEGASAAAAVARALAASA